MKLRSGICQCGREGPYAKPALKLCPICNQKRLNVIKEAKNVTKSGKTVTIVNRSSIKQKRKTTGEAALFKAIWESRPHICTNCKAILPEPARSFYFSHIKRKSTNNELRLDILNIELHCFDCHFAKDQGTKEQYDKLKN